MSKPKTFLFPLSLCLIAFLFFVVLTLHQYLFCPIKTSGDTKIIQIKPGHSFSQVATSLAEQGLIDSPNAFIILGKILGKTHQIKAGQFEVHTGWSRMKLLESLIQGQEILYRLPIPEGLTWWETGKRIKQSGLVSYERFRQAVHNQTLLIRYGLAGKTAEGYLFPETYTVSNATTTSALMVVKLMIQEFQNKTQDLVWPQHMPGFDQTRDTRYQTLILASLVEKEASLSEERRRIAGVFQNRLKRHMRLQCDPTVIYGLGPDFNGNLQRDDLEDTSNPYNTYVHPSLPPGPICSPGLDSIQAALSPEKHTYLYFVAKGDGSHSFSRTLREHNQAVRKYQLRSSRSK
jgi:UPF0755 protein